MKILLINDPGIPVPPVLYGGIERIVFQLANEYVKQGHEVTLLAGPNSYCIGNTITFGKNDLSKSKWQVLKEIFFVWVYLNKNHKHFDLVHNFGRLVYLLPVLNKSVKKIMSYQREVTVRNIRLVNKLINRNLYFTGCSDYISRKEGLSGNWHTVYNFVDSSNYTFVNNVPIDAPFIFLGRIERIKGCHHCISLALKTNRKLIIAGNISDLVQEKAYFENEILPFIDGDQIEYVGTVDDERKNYYLGKSLALLMLIDWNEPFGIVMAEALACGTPIIGFPKGAVNEVIAGGITGFIVDDLSSALKIVDDVFLIERLRCRVASEKQFNVSVIANKYLAIN